MTNFLEFLYVFTPACAAVALGYWLAARSREPNLAAPRIRRARLWGSVALLAAVAAAGLYWYLTPRP